MRNQVQQFESINRFVGGKVMMEISPSANGLHAPLRVMALAVELAGVEPQDNPDKEHALSPDFALPAFEVYRM
jgi:hypothetical protein